MLRGNAEEDACPGVRFAGAGDDLAIGEEDDEARGIRLWNDFASPAVDSERRIAVSNFGFTSLLEDLDLSNDRDGIEGKPVDREERSSFMGEAGARNAGCRLPPPRSSRAAPLAAAVTRSSVATTVERKPQPCCERREQTKDDREIPPTGLDAAGSGPAFGVVRDMANLQERKSGLLRPAVPSDVASVRRSQFQPAHVPLLLTSDNNRR